jgi:hypothetical protein
MTPEQRIKKHQKMIEEIREDIEWLTTSAFRTNPGTTPDTSNNAQLIEEQERNIVMYESFIAKLEGQVT